jgi:hypothetical protein
MWKRRAKQLWETSPMVKIIIILFEGLRDWIVHVMCLSYKACVCCRSSRRFRACGMCHCVIGWAAPDVLKDCSAPIFRVKQSKKNSHHR